MNPQYEYVASAMTYVTSSVKEDSDFSHINTMLAAIDMQHNHRVSMLYNAFTEENIGKKLKDTLNFNRIYADSGGLQMVSLGIGTISEEQKQKIYQNQAELSDIAMCFDQIPTIQNPAISKTTTLNVANARLFDPSIFESCARETANNILNQIKYFDKVKSNAKIVAILQGNDTSWYQKWLDIMLDVIPEERWEKISGIAFGSPAYGQGLMENIEKMFFISTIEAPDCIKKHFHLLGIGAINRLLPLPIFRASGLIPDDTLISFDSTKHTGGVTRAQYQVNEKTLQIRRDNPKDLLKLLPHVYAFAKQINMDVEESKIVDAIFLGIKDIREKWKPKNDQIIIDYKFMLFMMSVYHFIKTFDRCHTDKEYLMKCVDNDIMMALGKVKTVEDFKRWQSFAKSSIKEDRTPMISSESTLCSFF